MQGKWIDALPKPIAFVFSGGANLGAVQVGMLRGLGKAGLEPDIIVGTSVGALNGALVASFGLRQGTEMLDEIWQNVTREDIFPGGLRSQLFWLARNRLSLYKQSGIYELICNSVGTRRIEDLQIPFGAVATELITKRRTLFTSGDLDDVLLASTAIPGVYSPVTVNGEQFIDGGVTDTVPLSAAVEMQARSMVVLDVGNLCTPTEAPTHIGEMMSSVIFSMTRQRVLWEAPAIAQDYPILYLPRPCTLELGLFDFGHNIELMAETEEMVTTFLGKSQTPVAGAMRGKPHYHAV